VLRRSITDSLPILKEKPKQKPKQKLKEVPMADAYRCELASNQVLYLSNEGAMSAITLLSSGAGQQQQGSSHFTTGSWVAPPALYRLDGRLDGRLDPVNLVVISTAQTTYYLQLRGTQMQLSTDLSASLAAQLRQTRPVPMQREPMPAASPMPPMRPMSPMRPMQMHRNPMSMSMGDMQMSMGEMSSSTPSSASEAAKVKRFCAQCGSAVQPGDRFCAYCGDRLT
jgi:hypothetical protein